MPSTAGSNESSPSWVGFVFIFNLIVGTGALTLPAVFAKSGWLLSLIVVVFLAVISYMTASFVIETIACANAIRNFQNQQAIHEEAYDSGAEDDELLGNSNVIDNNTEWEQGQLRHMYYRLDRKFELGEMAALFFNDFGRMIFYLCLAIYLYGDLSIYTAAVAKTLRDIVCDPQNITTQGTTANASGLLMISLSYHSDDQDNTTPCWNQHSLSRLNVYRIFLVGFIALLGPFAFAQTAQKTKYLQIVTAICRRVASSL